MCIQLLSVPDFYSKVGTVFLGTAHLGLSVCLSVCLSVVRSSVCRDVSVPKNG